MNNVPMNQLVVGKQYVFGSESLLLGFVPITCNYGTCRPIVQKVKRKYVDVVLNNGSVDTGYHGEGFYEIDVAKKLYRQALEKRERECEAKGYRILTDVEINRCVDQL